MALSHIHTRMHPTYSSVVGVSAVLGVWRALTEAPIERSLWHWLHIAVAHSIAPTGSPARTDNARLWVLALALSTLASCPEESFSAVAHTALASTQVSALQIVVTKSVAKRKDIIACMKTSRTIKAKVLLSMCHKQCKNHSETWFTHGHNKVDPWFASHWQRSPKLQERHIILCTMINVCIQRSSVKKSSKETTSIQIGRFSRP